MTRQTEPIPAKELISTYQANTKRIAELGCEMREIDSRQDPAERGIKSDYARRIWELELERDKLIAKCKSRFGRQLIEKCREIKRLNAPILEVEKILQMLLLDHETDLAIPDENVSMRGGRHIEGLGYLHDSKHLKIKLFSVSNDKRVNRFTLAALGNCRFTSGSKQFFEHSLIELPHGSVKWLSVDSSVCFESELRFASEVKTLKRYLTRNRTKILSELIAKCAELGRKYDHVMATFTFDDFRPLFAYDCPNCSFFATESSKKNHSGYWLKQNKCPFCHTDLLRPNQD